MYYEGGKEGETYQCLQELLLEMYKITVDITQYTCTNQLILEPVL